MANKRMITGDFFEDDYFGQLDRDIRLLWLGLITSAADDQGRIFNSAALLRSKIFLYDTDINDDFITKSINKLADDGKIVCYVKNNKPLIQIVKWWVYQSPSWASPSKFPAPENWIDRAKYHTTGNKVSIINWDKQGGYIGNYIGELNGDLTPIDESEVKSKSEVKSDDKSEADLPTTDLVFVHYESDFGPLTPLSAEKLKDLKSTYPDKWIIDAMKLAVEKNVRNLAYIEAILKRWKAEGKDSGKKAGGAAKPKEQRTAEDYRKAWSNL